MRVRFIDIYGISDEIELLNSAKRFTCSMVMSLSTWQSNQTRNDSDYYLDQLFIMKKNSIGS